MSLIRHGIDLIEVSRIQQMVDSHGDRFLQRVFTTTEIAYAQSSKKRSAEHFAGRFAVKEAVLKAIGTGWRNGIAWTDIEIINDQTGRPSITTSGQVQVIADQLGITYWEVSLSHTDTHAIGSAIAMVSHHCDDQPNRLNGGTS